MKKLKSILGVIKMEDKIMRKYEKIKVFFMRVISFLFLIVILMVIINATKTKVKSEIRTKRLIIYDDSGNVRGAFGKEGLVVFSKGNVQLLLSANKDLKGLTIFYEQDPSIILRVNEAGRPGIFLYDRRGNVIWGR